MPEHRTEPEPSGLNLRNILLDLFKWKRTILGFAIFGIIAAAAIYLFLPESLRIGREAARSLCARKRRR